MVANQYEIIRLTSEQESQAQEETMGTKEKFWFYHSQLKKCLFKYPRQNTGEDWSEKVAFELCNLLDIPAARYELAETADGNKGVITVNFLGEGETLVHGNEVLSGINPDYPALVTQKAYQHTIEVVMEAIREKSVNFPPSWTVPDGFTDARDLFVGYLLLDAWIGNGDRHHENWGFVLPKTSQTGIYLAPTYDHASCLGRELSDTKRQHKSVESYVNRCPSAFYLNENEKKPLKTFELFEYVNTHYPKASQEWLNRLEQISEQQINSTLQAFPDCRISKEASDFANKILLTNKKRLLCLLNL
ncbi:MULTISPECIES: HipA domain-containing protein [unclassified Moorena]|uniref:HipA domain-containing protein n=1 Tax=unclassified Moorena TaxID=2683338 RepID=UPI0025DC0642|nr:MULTISPECIES: HipA domain-containing protein [unclassified Moorena]